MGIEAHALFIRFKAIFECPACSTGLDEDVLRFVIEVDRAFRYEREQGWVNYRRSSKAEAEESE